MDSLYTVVNILFDFFSKVSLGKGKAPDSLQQGHLLLLEGSTDQAIKSYQQVH